MFKFNEDQRNGLLIATGRNSKAVCMLRLSRPNISNKLNVHTPSSMRTRTQSCTSGGVDKCDPNRVSGFYEMGPNGSKWVQMGPNESKWVQMGPKWAKWDQMGINHP